jgi:dipeptidyl aminopeptidase/acylaminoacyl peptidase
MKSRTSRATRVCRSAAWVLMLAFGPAGAIAADAPSPIPVERFFHRAEISAAELSPSGRYVALTTASPTGRTLLAILDLDKKAEGLSIIANFADVDIRSFYWVNEDRLVFNTIDSQAPLNQQGFGPGLFSIKRDGSGQRELIRGRSGATITLGTSIAKHELGPEHVFRSTLDDGSDDVIIVEYLFNRRTHDVLNVLPKRLDVATGIARPISFGAPDNVRSWVFDRAGRPRVAVAQRADQTEVFWYAPESDSWQSIRRGATTRMTFFPLGVDAAGRLYGSDVDAEGRSVVKRFDVPTGRSEGTVLVSAKGFDLDPRLNFDRKTGELLGVRYETDAPGVTWFDPALKALQEVADARFPGRVNTIACRRCQSEDGVMLVRSYSDRDPGFYATYRVASRSWDLIGKNRPDIDPARMAPLDFYRTTARDGEDLPIWVTMPQGRSGPQPAVVLVHGGPWIRGVHWQWNPEAEFLASRGYVVLEPEFRGSDGYGTEHLVKGFRQWGRTMQDDLVDAVRWAANKGMVDPGRVCIAGASYGGYAALMGVIRDADTFRCGIAWVAVTDPRLLFEFNQESDSQSEFRDYAYPEMIGDPVKDAAMLRDVAPVEHAGEIRVPLLMAFGSRDRRVPIEHGRTMLAAMKSAGLDPEYVVYDGEGHGFLKLSNRVDFYTRVERFLAKNLERRPSADSSNRAAP